MSFSDDEEILQDFLLEVGEILELLSEQLIDLEQRPDDVNLLNAIFRGFHTVKGGAGFLQFEPMVEICHVTESLFDALRTGKRQVSSHLTDVVLNVLDAVNLQYDQISNSQPLEPADPHIITALAKLVRGEEHVHEEIQTSEKKEQGERSIAENESAVIADDEFEALLDELHGKGKAPTSARESNAKSFQQQTETPTENTNQNVIADLDNVDFTDGEFEDLLDELHGAGKAPGVKTHASVGASLENPETISEDEFENLLDQLHGVGVNPKGDRHLVENSPGGDEKKETPVPASAEITEETNNIAKSTKKVSVIKNPQDNNKSATSTGQHPAVEPTTLVGMPKKLAATNGHTKNTVLKEKKRGSNEVTVRVDTQRLDAIMNMVGELVLVRNRLVTLGGKRNDDELNTALGLLDVVTGDLQSEVMKTRMQPIRKVFARFPRVVRDLARSLNKEISLKLKGEDTDLDKNLVEALADPLIHLVRNAADHGIETPEERLRIGKNREGTVILDARQEGDHILLSIHDDGAGMDPDLLRKIAVEKHLIDADTADRLTDKEAFDLIFMPGFSTKTAVSDVSGRGVGMDVVKTKITQLNGLLDIDSTLGEGTCLTIKVPLTLAIMPALMILLEQQAFALPLVSVNEIFQMDLTHTHVVDGQECVMIRDKPVPIFHLKRWLVRKPNAPSDLSLCHVVIVSVGNTRVGFVVDGLIGQEEVVIKPLGKMLQGTPGMAGATITGDGSIALILDVPGILKQYAGTA